MVIRTRLVDYESGGHIFEGMLALDDDRNSKLSGRVIRQLRGLE